MPGPLDPSLRQAADLLTGQGLAGDSLPPAHWRIGTVTAIGAGTITATIGGVNVAALHFIQGVVPAVGDLVMILIQGPDHFVLGTISTDSLDAGPAVSMRRTSALSLANSAETGDIGFQTTEYDRGGMDTLGGFGFTAPRTGRYLLSARMSWDTSSAGRRFFSLYINSVLGPRWEGAPAPASGTIAYLTRPQVLAAGDSVTMRAFQSSGATLGANIGDYAFPFLAASWLGT
jgi:hypothetical protein